MTLHGTICRANVGADGAVSAGAPYSFKSIVLDESDIADWTDADMLRMVRTGVFTVPGGERGRPKLAAESESDALSLLRAARTPAAQTVAPRQTPDAAGYAAIGAPATPATTGKARKA